MKTYPLATSFFAIMLAGCGGGSISGSLADKFLPEEPVLVPAAAEPTPEDVNPHPYINEAINNTAFATVPDSETAQILTSVNFLFDTSNSVKLRINLAQAIDTQANVSICTDYQESANGYRINYNRCAVKAAMHNGQFEHQMELMNQFDSAIAVVWFPNQEFEPMYNEINLSDLAKGDEGYVWNWN